MAQTRVIVMEEVPSKEVIKKNKKEGKWTLCFQYCRYEMSAEEQYYGYRFIWRTPEGKLQPARGQARIPSIKIAKELMDYAIAEGWGEKSN